MGILELKKKPQIDFVRGRFLSFGLSSALVVLVLFVCLFRGLPYGVDFKGGVILEVRTSESLSKVRRLFNALVPGGVTAQTFGAEGDFLIRMEHSALPDHATFLKKLEAEHGKKLQVRRIEAVGPKVSSELLSKGLYAVFFALLAMLAYIWMRFEWRFGVAALAALIHDCIGVLGLYALCRFEFNETAIVAILITASYSINDTVVVFDRVRENKKRYGKMPLKELLNLSINETLSRTLLTSLTTLAALCVLYFFGGPVIASFSLPILVGLFVGTYSSICLASPLLMLFKEPLKAEIALVNQNTKKG